MKRTSFLVSVLALFVVGCTDSSSTATLVFGPTKDSAGDITSAVGTVTGVALWSVGAWTAVQSPADAVAAANAAGWQLPEAALQEMSPLTPTAGVIKKGKALYSSACQKCHGATGRGDGPYGDPKHRPADLTASTTADGVMFYKIWNGRKAPAMPPFKTTMTREEVWTVIEYARSLRTSDAR